MTRGVVLFLVGSGLLITLAACGRSWFEQRAPWRHDAEVTCLTGGAVKEGPGIEALRPIDGPGACGADFPLRVSALGTAAALSFTDQLEPPGLIPTPAVRAPTAMSQPGARSEPLPFGQSVPAPAAQSQPGLPLSLGLPTTPRVPAGPAVVTPSATLACPLIAALDGWVSTGIQPAAMRWFGQPVSEIKQISAYSCRPMNGQTGAAISEHAFGNALDIAAFTLADGRKVAVREGWYGLPADRAFLHDVQAAACRLFSTVLAPGSNVFHTDHIHVDLARHASGHHICKPAPLSGDLIAHGSDPLPTGSSPRPQAARAAPNRDQAEVPDED
jgi:Extensin-like protein C-terminus